RPVPAPHLIQRKLEVGAVDDPLEHEADRVADRVMLMTDAPAGGPMLQCKCAACAEEEQSKLQPKRTPAADRAPGADAPLIVHDVLRSPGAPLDRATRAFMEPRFERDFGAVRVHTDARASASARAVGAMAYTVGHDVVFAADRYAPQTSDGLQLLA